MDYKYRIDEIERKIIESTKSAPSKVRKSLTLNDVRDNILLHYKTNNSKNTFLSYKNTFDNFVRITGNKDINAVDKTVLEDFKIKRSNEVNLTSTNIDIRNIKAIFNKMKEFDYLSCSMIANVKQFKIKKKKVLAIDSTDVLNILNNIEDVQLKQIVRFTLLTASRISEVLSIKVKDVDFGNGVVNIYQQKTNSFKSIPLSTALTELINEVIHSEGEKNILTFPDKDSYLFYNKCKNNRHLKLRPDGVSKEFKKVLRKLNLSEDFKFHSLRHTAVTELMKNNVPLNVVKEIAGHKNIATTMTYSHVKSEDIKQAVNSLSY